MPDYTLASYCSCINITPTSLIIHQLVQIALNYAKEDEVEVLVVTFKCKVKLELVHQGGKSPLVADMKLVLCSSLPTGIINYPTELTCC